jgi:uncharacterized surface protein with fasciclin (FAS1) repeats
MNAKRFLVNLWISSLIIFFSASCDEEKYDEHLRTFTEETAASLLANSPDIYSEFYALLSETGIVDLLGAYGPYTVFAPTNEAVRRYFEEENTTADRMSHEEKRELVYNHILSVTLRSVDFPPGAAASATLGDRFLNFTYQTDETENAVFINDRSRVIVFDQEVHNGVVHTVDNVIRVSRVYLPEVIASEPRFSLFAEALYATGLADSLMTTGDPNYETGSEQSRKRNETTFWPYPDYLKRGCTAFVVNDSVFAANNIRSLDNLKAYAATVYDEMYPGDRNRTDLTDRHNSLNRFVAYHLMNRIQAVNEFLTPDMNYCYVPGAPRYAYIEMMAPNTLLEVLNATEINRRRNGSSIKFLTVNREAINGYIHEIDGLLTYDKGMESDVLNKRLRIDFASMIPELVSNKLRATRHWLILPRSYCSNISCTEITQLQYMHGNHNYEWDEVLPCGRYDFSIRIPPIPAGTWEIRFGYSPYAERGVAQIYFDNQPCGIPLNNSLYADNPKIGWIIDADTEDGGVENDKMMRNRGYMKGPTVLWTNDQTSIARDDSWCLRKILKTATFETTAPHFFRVKCVEEADKEFNLDYMEFYPVAMLDRDDRE